MLLGILDLEKITVNDIMVPRNEIIGLDLELPVEDLVNTITNSEHTRLPVYSGDINNIVGVLHMRKVNRVMRQGTEGITKEAIKRFSREPYFMPENTPLSTQLLNFRKHKRRIGFIVDEYGDVEGMVTIDDVLEEIVGSYTTSQQGEDELIERVNDQLYVIDGSASIRDINKETAWDLPTEVAKTLNGLALEYLEELPEGSVSFLLGDSYRAEAITLGNNVIEKIRVQRLAPLAKAQGE